MQHTTEGSPRARRWKAKKVHPSGVMEYKIMLDALTLENAIWTPDTGHIVHHEFDETSLFSGHIRWETLVARHLPKRFL